MSPVIRNHSYATPADIRVTHICLDLSVDMHSKIVSGSAELSLSRFQSTTELILDSDQLEITRIVALPTEEPLNFQIGVRDSSYGSSLHIELPLSVDKIRIEYQTSPSATAFQWLEPEQTFSKRLPFLYSQSWPILARSWIPCQDTPAVRMTYEATIRTPRGLNAAMSAVRTHADVDQGIYRFEMRQAIPSFLIALAVGEMKFVQISERCGVYAEPDFVDQCAWEFTESETILSTAERLYGAYQWDRWDILVLPPSFPYGGMENPQLTFVSSSWICGDRSMVHGITHELAHSWSGNLVVHCDWDDFWITEAFTVYCERRITEELHGRDFADAVSYREHQVLLKWIHDLGPDHPETALHADLGTRNPEEVLTPLRFYKGYLFLRHLEEVFGRAQWDVYLKQYLQDFAFQSICAEDFLQHIRQHLIAGDVDLEKRASLKEWIFNPGLPAQHPMIVSKLLERVKILAAQMHVDGALPPEASGLSSMVERIYFLQCLPDQMDPSLLENLERGLDLDHARNPDLLTAWLRRVIKNQFEASYPTLMRFLSTNGNLRNLKTLYQELATLDDRWAREWFEKFQDRYHSLTRLSIKAILRF